MIFVILSAEVELDRSAFEDTYRGAGGFVNDGRNAPVCC